MYPQKKKKTPVRADALSNFALFGSLSPFNNVTTPRGRIHLSTNLLMRARKSYVSVLLREVMRLLLSA